MTTVARTTPDSASLADSILRAMEKGSLRQIEVELDRVEGACRKARESPALRAERMELLEAVAQGLHGSVTHVCRRSSNRLEGVEVHLYLLKHLACSRS